MDVIFHRFKSTLATFKNLTDRIQICFSYTWSCKIAQYSMHFHCDRDLNYMSFMPPQKHSLGTHNYHHCRHHHHNQHNNQHNNDLVMFQKNCNCISLGLQKNLYLNLASRNCAPFNPQKYPPIYFPVCIWWTLNTTDYMKRIKCIPVRRV